ncbi:MAG TPA: FAD-dependent oxidoreductase [Ktedonobacterales bacterium]|jgi:flavin-dependent dehydrogenase|nr:FAD-dependent oxidoreductase [Ktedonobacterales bacterium]
MRDEDIEDIWDVAIIGAGPAGSATATHLARNGHRVVLVDRGRFPRDKPCAEYLSPAAEPLLVELGVTDLVSSAQTSRLRGFRIFAPSGVVFQGDFAATRDAAGCSVYESGLAIPRLRLDAALLAGARHVGVDVREGWRLAQLYRQPNARHWILRSAEGGESISARLLIAADGLHSTVARRLGLHTPGRMRKIALVAHVRGIAGLSDYGEMHIADRRYVGLAPLESRIVGDLCNVAMVVDERRDGQHLSGRAQQYLLKTLATFPRLRGRLDHLEVVRPTLATSRLSVRARHVSGDNLLLVGDATGYYDPFTGEGIYRALRSAQLAARVADAALNTGDLSAHILAHYDRLLRDEFRGKRTIESIIQLAVRVPALTDHIARVLSQHKSMADTIVAVTGDFLPPSAVLRPGYLIRLVL